MRRLACILMLVAVTSLGMGCAGEDDGVDDGVAPTTPTTPAPGGTDTGGTADEP